MFLFLKSAIVLVVYIAWSILFFDNIVRSKYFIDENNRIIFYPDSIETGYVATQEQIDKSAKAFRKCFVFNLSGYKKDIKQIFANSEIVNKKLPPVTFQKNQAQRMSWLFLISWFVIAISVIIATYDYKLLFFIMLIMSFQSLMILFFKIKYCR